MISVTILGNNSAIPSSDRHPTAQVVTCGDMQLLMDCGEGTQMQMSKYQVKRGKINHIFISHLHGDHYFGLIGLLNSYGLLSRERPLHLYGPPDLKRIIDLQLDCASTVLGYDLHFVPLIPGESKVLVEEKNARVSCFPTNHRIPCFGFVFRELFPKRKILPQKAELEKIPVSFYSSLQEGKDFIREDGTRVANTLVTLDPTPDKSYAFCADTLYDKRIIPFIKGCDLIYHETTYMEDQRDRALTRFHSTTLQAAAIAREAGVKKLLIGHFSSKYVQIEPFAEECRTVFPNTDLAIEGNTYTAE